MIYFEHRLVFTSSWFFMFCEYLILKICSIYSFIPYVLHQSFLFFILKLLSNSIFSFASFANPITDLKRCFLILPRYIWLFWHCLWWELCSQCLMWWSIPITTCNASTYHMVYLQMPRDFIKDALVVLASLSIFCMWWFVISSRAW